MIVLGGILIIAVGIAAIFGTIIGLTKLVETVRNAIDSNQYSQVATIEIDADSTIFNAAAKDDSLYIEVQDDVSDTSCKTTSLMKYDLKNMKTSWISKLSALDCGRGLGEDVLYVSDDGIAVTNTREDDTEAFDNSGASYIDSSLTEEWAPLYDNYYVDGRTLLNGRTGLSFIEDGKKQQILLVDGVSEKIITTLDNGEQGPDGGNWKKRDYINTPVGARWVSDNEIALYYQSCKGTSECEGDYSFVRRLVKTDGSLEKMSEIHYASKDDAIHRIRSLFANGSAEYALVTGPTKDGRKELKILKFNW